MPWEALGVVLGVVLGLANLGLYWFTWRRENRRQERLATMQGRLTAIEEARRNEELASRESASVSARFKQEPNSSGSGTNHWLVLSNGGPAVARNASVEVVAPVLMERSRGFAKRRVRCPSTCHRTKSSGYGRLWWTRPPAWSKYWSAGRTPPGLTRSIGPRTSGDQIGVSARTSSAACRLLRWLAADHW